MPVKTSEIWERLNRILRPVPYDRQAEFLARFNRMVKALENEPFEKVEKALETIKEQESELGHQITLKQIERLACLSLISRFQKKVKGHNV